MNLFKIIFIPLIKHPLFIPYYPLRIVMVVLLLRFEFYIILNHH